MENKKLNPAEQIVYDVCMVEFEKLIKKEMPELNITYNELRSKVLPGYAYSIIGGSMRMMTGKGGAIMYLNSCEKSGIPAFVAGDNLIVEGESLNKIKIDERPNPS